MARATRGLIFTPDGRVISRGTVVHLRLHGGRHAVGIVTGIVRGREENYATVALPQRHTGGVSIAERGMRKRPLGCVSYTLRVSYMEPIGRVKRVPKCALHNPHALSGLWIRPSPRKHRIREAEVGQEIARLQEQLDVHQSYPDDARVALRKRDLELQSRLVRLDQKVANLARGPRRRHR